MKRLGALLLCLLGLAGCEFDRADEPTAQQVNSCKLTTDCTVGSECMAGLCVAAAADAELEIALQVTPLRTADSDPPQPVLIENVKVKSNSVVRRFDLPLPVELAGVVRDGDSTVDAMLSFTPTRTLRGTTAATVSVSTTPSAVQQDIDYDVQLTGGVEYSLLVRPADINLPPWRTTFTARPGESPSVDYAELEMFAQTYSISAPKDRVLLVRAVDVTHQPISSTATIVGGKATLQFATEPGPYKLEIYAEHSYAPMAASAPKTAQGTFCDDATPVFPSYSIDSDELPAKDKSGAITVKLPAAPPRIRFEGTIAVCDQGLAAISRETSPVLMELPVTLHSNDQLVSDPKFDVAFDAQTTAQLDTATNELTFCVQLMEGKYDVVVTPPTNLPCAVYAQRLTIDAPDDIAASGMLIELPKSAQRSGTLETADAMPLAGATVEAVALGRATGFMLADDETATLTRYNRSRQAVTESDGTFVLPVDLGSYDMLFKPPAASGYSWLVRHDVGVGRRDAFKQPFPILSPVMLTGRIAYAMASATQQMELAGAEVLAYAVIADKIADGDVTVTRAVPIGKAMASADGSFTLLLPQDIMAEW